MRRSFTEYDSGRASQYDRLVAQGQVTPPPYYRGPLRAETIEVDGIVQLVKHMATAASYWDKHEDPQERRAETADFVAFMLGIDGDLSPDDLAILPVLHRRRGGRVR